MLASVIRHEESMPHLELATKFKTKTLKMNKKPKFEISVIAFCCNKKIDHKISSSFCTEAKRVDVFFSLIAH